MLFLDSASNDPQYYVAWVGFVIFSICIHESSHAYLAAYYGDDTPRDYISLNPLKQMGWLSIGLLLIIGVAWGSVPVNPRRIGSRGRNAMVCLAGPLANLALCAVFALLSQTSRLWGAPETARLLMYGSSVNGVLFLFNLCPIPPLDGFGVVRFLFVKDDKMQAALNRLAGIGFLLLFLTPLGSMIFQAGSRLASFFSAVWIAPFHLFS